MIRPLATTAVLAGLLLIVRPAAVARDDAGPDKGVAFSGRVVDVETRKPVEGASIVVVRSIPGVPPEGASPWVGEIDDPDAMPTVGSGWSSRPIRWPSGGCPSPSASGIPATSPGNP